MSFLKEMVTDYLILLNEDNKLPENFEDTIELISVKNSEGTEYRIEKKAYEAFLSLREDVLSNNGFQIELISVYRTVAEQVETKERYLKSYGPEYTKKYVAIPGCSEHHTGFAIDVGIVIGGKITRKPEELLAADALFKIVQAKLSKYGFILRYPEGKEAITKISYEPWHFRYIDSQRLAEEITEAGLCFEEYWERKLNG